MNERFKSQIIQKIKVHKLNFIFVVVEGRILLCWKLQTYFDASILEENNKPLCDELCENIFIIMTKGYSCLKTQNKYASLNGKMTIVKNTNVNDVKSLTTKSKFRYYDMFDYVEKVEK